MDALEKALLDQFGTPTPKQEQFYNATGTRFVGYGGAKYGGKSHGLRAKLTYLGYQYPGISMLLVRKSLKDLKENHTVKLLYAYEKFPLEDRPRYNTTDNVFNFPNGSRLKLGYCDTEDDLLQYQGQEYDIVCLDEATQFTDNQYQDITSCARGKSPFPKRVYLTCNPGGVGHWNIRRLFIEKKYRKKERESDYTFIQAFAWDNYPAFDTDPAYIEKAAELKAKYKVKKLTPEMQKEAIFETPYMRQLLSAPKDQVEAFVYGNWYMFAGQFFSEWDEDLHVVKPFQIPAHWRRTAALDYGFDCFAVLWFAVSPEGNVVCYRSTEDKGLAASDAAMKLKEYERGENIETHYAPPDFWKRSNDTGRSAAQIFMEHNISLTRSSTDREQGWINVKEYLKVLKDKDGKAIKGYPRMVFFDTCEPVIECVPKLQFDKHKPNDAAEQPHDITHSPSALRYWCTMWQINADPLPGPEKSDPWGLEEPEDDGVTEEYLLGGY